MTKIIINVTDGEKHKMDYYARTHGINLSSAIKQAFIEKMENELNVPIKEDEKN